MTWPSTPAFADLEGDAVRKDREMVQGESGPKAAGTFFFFLVGRRQVGGYPDEQPERRRQQGWMMAGLDLASVTKVRAAASQKQGHRG